MPSIHGFATVTRPGRCCVGLLLLPARILQVRQLQTSVDLARSLYACLHHHNVRAHTLHPEAYRLPFSCEVDRLDCWRIRATFQTVLQYVRHEGVCALQHERPPGCTGSRPERTPRCTSTTGPSMVRPRVHERYCIGASVNYENAVVRTLPVGLPARIPACLLHTGGREAHPRHHATPHSCAPCARVYCTCDTKQSLRGARSTKRFLLRGGHCVVELQHLSSRTCPTSACSRAEAPFALDYPAYEALADTRTENMDR